MSTIIPDRLPRPRPLFDFRMEAVSFEVITLEHGQCVRGQAKVAGYFYYVLAGKVVAHTDQGSPIHLAEGDTLVVNGLVNHSVFDRSTSATRLLVGIEPFEHISWMKGTPPLLFIPADDPRPLVRRVHLAMALVVEEISDQKTPVDQLTLERAAELILLYFFRLIAPEPGRLDPFPWSDGRLMAAITAMSSEPARPWTVDQLARVASMSRSAFALRFRQHLGETPMQMLSRIRVRAAAEKILQGNPISDAASSVGYGSEEAFSRSFKRLFGTTPGRWKRQRSA